MINANRIRAYNDVDLQSVLDFVGYCAASPVYGGSHPGDILHTMSNGLRGKQIDPKICFYMYEENGALTALIKFEAPGNLHFEVIMHPDNADAEPVLEADLYRWASQFVVTRSPETPKSDATVMAAVDTSNVQRNERLRALGYRLGDPYLMGSMRDLEGELPQFLLPEAFQIRGTSEADVEQLISVHSSAFGTVWTVDRYLQVMRTPGFEPKHELVAVAPDGQFGAFIIIWFDPISRIGLFEPVGTHKAFQRRGLGKALMSEGLRRMKAAGMTHARVNHQLAVDNAASPALYASMGFVDCCGYFDATKPVSNVVGNPYESGVPNA